MTKEVESTLALVPGLLKLSHQRIWTAYDKEADVLYINFNKPSRADDAVLTEGDIIVRYQKEEIVGVTVLNASSRETK